MCDRLERINTKLGELCLQMTESAGTIDVQLDELLARSKALKEEQPVLSEDTEVMNSMGPLWTLGDDELITGATVGGERVVSSQPSAVHR